MAGVVLLVLVSLLLVTKEDGAGGHGAQRRMPCAVDRVVTGAVLGERLRTSGLRGAGGGGAAGAGAGAAGCATLGAGAGGGESTSPLTPLRQMHLTEKLGYGCTEYTRVMPTLSY